MIECIWDCENYVLWLSLFCCSFPYYSKFSTETLNTDVFYTHYLILLVEIMDFFIFFFEEIFEMGNLDYLEK